MGAVTSGGIRLRWCGHGWFSREVMSVSVPVVDVFSLCLIAVMPLSVDDRLCPRGVTLS